MEGILSWAFSPGPGSFYYVRIFYYMAKCEVFKAWKYVLKIQSNKGHNFHDFFEMHCQSSCF